MSVDAERIELRPVKGPSAVGGGGERALRPQHLVDGHGRPILGLPQCLDLTPVAGDTQLPRAEPAEAHADHQDRGEQREPAGLQGGPEHNSTVVGAGRRAAVGLENPFARGRYADVP